MLRKIDFVGAIESLELTVLSILCCITVSNQKLSKTSFTVLLSAVKHQYLHSFQTSQLILLFINSFEACRILLLNTLLSIFHDKHVHIHGVLTAQQK